MIARPLSSSDLQAHLEEQVGFLKASADAFDGGNVAEAKRLAATLRILLHDTPKSHSLLGQLGRKGDFWDTAVPDMPGNLVPLGGLVCVHLAPGAPKYAPLFDDFAGAHESPFATWWTAPVFRDPRGPSLSRKDLVLTAANKDGGAHVDPGGVDERYARFALENGLGVTSRESNGERPLEGAVAAAIRQVAHEVLRTLDPTYRKSRAPGGGAPPAAIIGPLRATIGPKVKLGRNDPCSCGSGRKYKKCHGA
jgi:hypothetical protein